MFDLVKLDKQSLLANPEILHNVYAELKDLSSEYPRFSYWFWNVMRLGLFSGERAVFCAYAESRVAGIMILKNQEEKKICTLRVKEEFQLQGLGRQFVRRAKFFLKCDTPLVTVPDKHIEEFRPLFAASGFSLRAKYPDYYTLGSDEFAYNGLLEVPQKREII